MPTESRLGQHDAGRRLGDIGRRRHRDSHLRLAQRRRVVGAVAAHTNSVAALLERLDEVVLSLRKNAGENREILGANIGGDGPGRTDRSIQAHRASDDRCRRRGVAGHHDGAHSQRVQFRNERRRIRSRRIAESNDSGKFQRRWRTDRDGQNPEALRLKFVRRLGRIGRPVASVRRLRQRPPSRRAPWRRSDRWQSPPTSSCAGSNGTNLISFGRSEAAFFAAAARMARIYRILPAVRTRQGSHSQDVRFVEAGHGMNGGYRQFVLRQRAGLIRAQHVDACRFIHRGEPRWKDAQLCQSLARRAPPQG